MEDVTYAIPQNQDIGQIGAVVATGNTILESITKLKEYSDQIEGHGIDIRMESIPKIIKELHDAKNKSGYTFGDDKLPSVEEVSKLIEG